MLWHARAGMGWWMLFSGVLWVVFWGTVVYLAVTLFRRLDGGSRQQESAADALEIAKRRYARGDISRDSFEQIRKDIAA